MEDNDTNFPRQALGPIHRGRTEWKKEFGFKEDWIAKFDVEGPEYAAWMRKKNEEYDSLDEFELALDQPVTIQFCGRPCTVTRRVARDDFKITDEYTKRFFAVHDARFGTDAGGANGRTVTEERK